MDILDPSKMMPGGYESNDTTDEAVDIRPTRKWMTNEYLSICLVSIYIPFNLISNSLVVTAVLKFKRLQIPANYFMVALSVADMIVALILPFYLLVEVTSPDITDDVYCLAVNRSLMTAAALSMLTLAIIAYDRCIAITRPFEYVRIMTKRKILILVLASYVYSGLIIWTPFVCRWYYTVSNLSLTCSDKIFDNKSRLLFIISLYVPSFCCITICYYKIFLVARHHTRAIAAIKNNFQQEIKRKFFKTDTKYAKTIAIVIVLFFVLWTPYQLCLLIQITGVTELNSWVKHYLMLLAFANSCFNPWVYTFTNKDLRAAFKTLLLPCKSIGHRLCPESGQSSIGSKVSILPSSGHLDRANSRIVESDILYVLSKLESPQTIENGLNRQFTRR